MLGKHSTTKITKTVLSRQRIPSPDSPKPDSSWHHPPNPSNTKEDGAEGLLRSRLDGPDLNMHATICLVLTCL